MARDWSVGVGIAVVGERMRRGMVVKALEGMNDFMVGDEGGFWEGVLVDDSVHIWEEL